MFLFSPPPLEIRATELARALPQIGERYGVRMRVTPNLAEEIVVARLTDASLEETKDRLAEAFAAKWQVSANGTITLWSDHEAGSAQQRAWIEGRRARVRAEQRRFRKAVERPLTAQDREAYGAALAELREQAVRKGQRRNRALPDLPSPMSRLAQRLVASVPPEQLETGELDSHAVFSTTPTKLQRALPVGTPRAIEAYLRDRAAFGAPTLRETGPTPPPIGSVTLSVQRATDVIGCSVRVYDVRGVGVESYFLTLDLREVPSRIDPGVDAAIPYAFEPSQEVREAEAVFRSPQRLPFVRVRPILMREPLGFGTSDVLLSAARLADRNLICNPGDAAFAVPVGDGKGDLRAWARGMGGAAALVGERWLRVRMLDPHASRLAFVDRKTLRRIVGTLEGEEPSLEEQTALAPVLPERGRGGTAGMFAWMASSGHFSPSEFPLVKLYAALSPEDRSAAQKEIRIDRLSPVAARRLREYVLGGARFFRIHPERDSVHPGPEARLFEPTTLFGTDPARGGAVWEEGTLTLEEPEERLIVVPRGGEPQSYTVDRFASVAHDPMAAAKAGFDMAALRVVTRRRAEIRLRWRSQHGVWGMDLSLPGGPDEASARRYRLAELPEEIWRPLQAAIVSYRLAFNGNPPPPR